MIGGTENSIEGFKEASLGRNELHESSQDEALEKASGLHPSQQLR
jgi:hypothetical protein